MVTSSQIAVFQNMIQLTTTILDVLYGQKQQQIQFVSEEISPREDLIIINQLKRKFAFLMLECKPKEACIVTKSKIPYNPYQCATTFMSVDDCNMLIANCKHQTVFSPLLHYSHSIFSANDQTELLCGMNWSKLFKCDWLKSALKNVSLVYSNSLRFDAIAVVLSSL